MPLEEVDSLVHQWGKRTHRGLDLKVKSNEKKIFPITGEIIRKAFLMPMIIDMADYW